MSNERTGLYEGMFLFPQSATANLKAAVEHLQGILEKSGATTLTFRKWDERRLAFEVDGNKRGVYFLVYFNAPTDSISELERRCNQSEDIIRMMVTRADHIPSEIIEANDGKDDLATEIKSKGEQKTKEAKSAASKISKKEDTPAVETTEVKEDSSQETEETKESDEVAKPSEKTEAAPEAETKTATEEVSEEVSEA